jgi:hypothetical protein
MENIILCPESVAAYKELLTNPAANGLDIKPIGEYFEASETPTAKHILFEQFIAVIKKPLPKIFFYIIMDEMHPQCGKDENGFMGYYLKLKNS